MKRHPSTTPLDEWPRAWLVFELTQLIESRYFVMHDHEKREKGYPVTVEEMRDYIRKQRGT